MVSDLVELVRRDEFSAVVYGEGTDAPVVALRGEVDLVSAPELIERLTEVLQRRPRSLVLDLTDVSFMDAAGVRAVVYARRAIPDTCPVALLRPSCLVRRVLEITGMDELCTISE